MRTFLFLALALVSALPHADAQEGAPSPSRWRWRFVAGGATVGSGAFADDGTFYFAAEDRYLYAIDRNGTMIWRTDLGRRPGGSVALGADGAVLATLANGELLSLNRDGRLIWRVDVDEEAAFDPVVLGNGVIVTVHRPSTVEARTHAGTLVWTANVGSPVSSSPIAAVDGTIVAPTVAGELVSVSLDGRITRRRYVGEVASVLASTGDGTLLGSANGRIVAVDRELEPVWRADVGSAIRALRVGTDAQVYATSDDGALTRITPEGAIAWKAQPGSARMISHAAADGVLAIVSDGLLSRLGRDGSPLWQMRLIDPPSSLVLAPYGAAVIPTGRWVTYAYETEFVSSGPWAEERGGRARRGTAPGAGSGRVPLGEFERSVDYLALRALLYAGGQSEQAVAMARIASRVEAGEDLAGSYHYLLALSESVAGSPYFGPLGQSGPRSAPRRARVEAIDVIGAIGDLESSRFLARLLEYEPDPSLQAQILRSMGRLGTPVDETLAARLTAIVRRDVVRGPNDVLGLAVSGFVSAVDAYRGGYLHPQVANTLLEVASANYSRSVREAAISTLRSLAGADAP